MIAYLSRTHRSLHSLELLRKFQPKKVLQKTPINKTFKKKQPFHPTSIAWLSNSQDTNLVKPSPFDVYFVVGLSIFDQRNQTRLFSSLRSIQCTCTITPKFQFCEYYLIIKQYLPSRPKRQYIIYIYSVQYVNILVVL